MELNIKSTKQVVFTIAIINLSPGIDTQCLTK